MAKTFIIDANNFSDLNGFYEEIGKKLTKAGWKSGRNLDAFNDILRGGFGNFEKGEAVTIIWKDAAKSQKELDHAQAAIYLNSMLERCHPQNERRILTKIKDAKVGAGPTLYEMLKSVFTAHPHITFKTE